MKFVCESGKHKEVVEAQSFEDAASIFLEHVTTQNNDPKLGTIVYVQCETKDAFFDTSDSLSKMGVKKVLRVYSGSK